MTIFHSVGPFLSIFFDLLNLLMITSGWTVEYPQKLLLFIQGQTFNFCDLTIVPFDLNLIALSIQPLSKAIYAGLFHRIPKALGSAGTTS